MFRFTCPICHHGLKASEAISGKRVKCPGCGEVITVPEPVAAPQEPNQPRAPVTRAAGPQAAPPSEEPAQPGGKETSPWWYEEVKVGHGASEAGCAPPPAFFAPPVPPANAGEQPHPAVSVAAAAPPVVPPSTTELRAGEEPMPPWPGWPDHGAGKGHDHDSGQTEHAPDPAFAALAAQPAIAEDHPQPPASVPDAVPIAHHRSATELAPRISRQAVMPDPASSPYRSWLLTCVGASRWPRPAPRPPRIGRRDRRRRPICPRTS